MSQHRQRKTRNNKFEALRHKLNERKKGKKFNDVLLIHGNICTAIGKVLRNSFYAKTKGSVSNHY